MFLFQIAVPRNRRIDGIRERCYNSFLTWHESCTLQHDVLQYDKITQISSDAVVFFGK